MFRMLGVGLWFGWGGGGGALSFDVVKCIDVHHVVYSLCVPLLPTCVKKAVVKSRWEDASDDKLGW